MGVHGRPIIKHGAILKQDMQMIKPGKNEFETPKGRSERGRQVDF